jgi:hypothetical protein
MVDAMVSNTIGCKVVRVRVSLPALFSFRRRLPARKFFYAGNRPAILSLPAMKSLLCCLFWGLMLVLPALLPAQPATSQEFKPVVRRMTPEQKLRLLDYLQHLGTDLDRLILNAYDQLKAPDKDKTILFAGMVQEDPAMLSRTTVQWNRDTIFFDTLEAGLVLLDSFQVTNTGAYPYVIHSVKTSCDCTVLAYPTRPLMPGESATLRVEFDSRSKAGLSQPGIIVYDNSAPNARNILYLHGEVRPDGPLKRKW